MIWQQSIISFFHPSPHSSLHLPLCHFLLSPFSLAFLPIFPSAIPLNLVIFHPPPVPFPIPTTYPSLPLSRFHTSSLLPSPQHPNMYLWPILSCHLFPFPPPVISLFLFIPTKTKYTEIIKFVKLTFVYLSVCCDPYGDYGPFHVHCCLHHGHGPYHDCLHQQENETCKQITKFEGNLQEYVYYGIQNIHIG